METASLYPGAWDKRPELMISAISAPEGDSESLWMAFSITLGFMVFLGIWRIASRIRCSASPPSSRGPEPGCAGVPGP